MRAHHSKLIGVASAALFLASAATVQAQGKSKDKDKDHGKGHVQTMPADDRRHDGRDGRVVIDQRVGQRNDPRTDPRYDPRLDPRYDPRNQRTEDRRIPPGLAKKPGGMPPGQYKKRYGSNDGAVALRDVLGRRGYTVVRTQDAGESRYVYYRLRDGATRRAIVSPGTDRLQFSNVPSSLLTEVLARLY